MNWDAFEGIGHVNIFNRSTKDEGIARCQDSDVVICNKFLIGADFLRSCPHVKLICVAATGYNNVDVNLCKEKEIVVSNVSSYSTSSVAQHVFSLILHIYNKVGKHNLSVKKGYWSVCPDFSFTLHSVQELKGLNLGIYGYGQIGEAVAKIADAFGMKVLAHSRSKQKGEEAFVQFVDKETLIRESDILTLHASLNEESQHFINASSLDKMKSNALLINTGRGGLINEVDLAEALYEEKIMAAGLDVLSVEPASLSHPFYKLSNCVITPHMAWASFQSRQRLMQGIIENIKAYLKGKPINVV